MSARRIVYVMCDVGKARNCDITTADIEGASFHDTLASARRFARSEGWRHRRGVGDVCPKCNYLGALLKGEDQ